MLAALIACRRIMVLPDPCASRQFGMIDWEHVYACLGEGVRRVNLGHSSVIEAWLTSTA